MTPWFTELQRHTVRKGSSGMRKTPFLTSLHPCGTKVTKGENEVPVFCLPLEGWHYSSLILFKDKLLDFLSPQGIG